LLDCSTSHVKRFAHLSVSGLELLQYLLCTSNFCQCAHRPPETRTARVKTVIKHMDSQYLRSTQTLGLEDPVSLQHPPLLLPGAPVEARVAGTLSFQPVHLIRVRAPVRICKHRCTASLIRRPGRAGSRHSAALYNSVITVREELSDNSLPG
jgi:hypothetical protein